MSHTVLCRAFILSVALAACAAPAEEFRAAGGRYKAVLIAGDASLPVFDNAVAEMQSRLVTIGAADRGNIRRLSASPEVAAHAGSGATSTPDNILDAVASMRPDAGQSCFVYATSHGAEGFGFVLGLTDEFISPQDFDAALVRGCRGAPTVVVISACFSGIYARPPMTRPNRIVLTAARPDRTSFGCHAGRVYTVYDKCLLAAFDAGGSWKQAYASIRQCVGLEERREHVLPSEPQAWFGAVVADLYLPAKAAVSH